MRPVELLQYVPGWGYVVWIDSEHRTVGFAPTEVGCATDAIKVAKWEEL